VRDMKAFRLLAAAAVALLMVSCGDDNGPTAPGSGCLALAGTWTVHISNSCGQDFTEQIAITQTGCDVSGILGSGEGFSGRIDGDQVDFTVTNGCSSASGTATIHTNSSISGGFGGQITRTGCACPVGPYSGSFSLTR
jgi:hypothetical protein